eukprot:2238392-Karenia_brevis.AAC.1
MLADGHIVSKLLLRMSVSTIGSKSLTLPPETCLQGTFGDGRGSTSIATALPGCQLGHLRNAGSRTPSLWKYRVDILASPAPLAHHWSASQYKLSGHALTHMVSNFARRALKVMAGIANMIR